MSGDPSALEEELVGYVLHNPQAYFEVDRMVRAEDLEHPLSRCLWRAIGEAHNAGGFSWALVESCAKDVPDGVVLGPYISMIAYAAKVADAPLALPDLAGGIAERAKTRSLHEQAHWLVTECSRGVMPAEEMVSAMVHKMTSVLAGRTDAYTEEMTHLVRAAARRALAPVPDTRGISVGVPEIEELVGQLMPGDVCMFAAPSGTGKSGVAMQIAWHVSGQGKPVEFFEIEVDGPTMGERQLAALTGYPVRRLRAASLNAAERAHVSAAVDMLGSRPLKLHWQGKQRIGQIRLRVLGAHYRSTNGLGLVVIDHLKLVQPDATKRGGGGSGERVAVISDIMADIKALAKEANVPILVLAQITRKSQERMTSAGFSLREIRPRIYDIFGGGDVEELSDMVILAHRPELTLENLEPYGAGAFRGGRDNGPTIHEEWEEMVRNWKNKVELLGPKVRNGPGGQRRVMRWIGDRMMFGSLTGAME